MGVGDLIVNQIPDEGICPEEHRDEGSLLIADYSAGAAAVANPSACITASCSAGLTCAIF
jgi:hypothetical protein